MRQPISPFGESAARYLRDNVAVGVAIKDPRIEIAGKLPPPNSSIYRSSITPFLEHQPERGGYHIHLNMTVDELASLTRPEVSKISAMDLRRLGNFITQKLDHPGNNEFFDRRLGALMRDGGIKIISFPGGLPRGASEDKRVPYICFQFEAGNLAPDPQNRIGQMAHAIRRLNQIFEVISRQGLELFSEQESRHNQLAKEWSSIKLPAEEFSSLRSKMEDAFGLKIAPEAITFDNRARFIEESGKCHVRLSLENTIGAERRDEIFEKLSSQLGDLNGFIAQQLGDDFSRAGGFSEVELIKETGAGTNSYFHFTVHTPTASTSALDMDQALWLTDSLYNDFVEVLRPFERDFVMQYE